jgi:hypothetical protein
MTKLPPPKQWVFCKMNEMEVAEMIEHHIDFYEVDRAGNRHSVHLQMPFVRHYMNRDDGVLATGFAIATSPIVLADGNLLAPSGLDRKRGIVFIIPPELRNVVPRPEECTPDAVKAAMEFLCNDWLVDVAADGTGKALLVAAALTLIERSLMPERPCFFVTAGRRGNGKTTTIFMLIKAVTGDLPSSSAWSPNEEERRKALMAMLIKGLAYILWDNIPRGSQISCPHIERACTTAYYSDRKLGVTETLNASASTVHLFTGNNIGPKGDLASRSLNIRLSVDRADPENRDFKHPDPIGWTDKHRAEIIVALYTILLGNPQLKEPVDAEGKTRFKIWWRLVGAAVENAVSLVGGNLDFQSLFASQEEEDEESATLADALEVMLKQWSKEFTANDVAALINIPNPGEDVQTLRDFLLPGAVAGHAISAVAIGKILKKHLDGPVNSAGRALVLRSREDKHTKKRVYYVAAL